MHCTDSTTWPQLCLLLWTIVAPCQRTLALTEGHGEKSKSPFRTAERPTSLFLPQRFYNSNLFLTTFCFLPWVIVINRTHTRTLHIYIDACADIQYYCTQLVQMQCTSVYTTHINGTHKHTRTLHFIFIDSCTDMLYHCTQLYCKYLLTNESKINFMNGVDQSQLWFLSISTPFPLNCHMLTTALLPRRRAVVKKHEI